MPTGRPDIKFTYKGMTLYCVETFQFSTKQTRLPERERGRDRKIHPLFALVLVS